MRPSRMRSGNVNKLVPCTAQTRQAETAADETRAAPPQRSINMPLLEENHSRSTHLHYEEMVNRKGTFCAGSLQDAHTRGAEVEHACPVEFGDRNTRQSSTPSIVRDRRVDDVQTVVSCVNIRILGQQDFWTVPRDVVEEAGCTSKCLRPKEHEYFVGTQSTCRALVVVTSS